MVGKRGGRFMKQAELQGAPRCAVQAGGLGQEDKAAQPGRGGREQDSGKERG